MVELSLVIPAYNEAERIEGTLRAVCGYLRGCPYTSEVLVVDDGSTDGTADRVRACIEECAGMLRLLQLPHNQGKGAAVRAGLLQSQGRQRVFFDADGSTPIEEVEKLRAAFAGGADVAIGSRALTDSVISVRQAWYRERMGRVFNVVLRALGLSRFRDTQCGFKGFTAEACAIILPRQTVTRFSFDAELLFIAHLHGLRVVEVPVVWRNSPQSRVNPFTDSLNMFVDLLRMRLKGWRGAYD